jgi:hypothetical protein
MPYSLQQLVLERQRINENIAIMLSNLPKPTKWSVHFLVDGNTSKLEVETEEEAHSVAQRLLATGAEELAVCDPTGRATQGVGPWCEHWQVPTFS